MKIAYVVFAYKLEYLLHKIYTTQFQLIRTELMYAAINVYELLFSYKQTAQSDKYQNLKYLQHLYGSVQERIKLQLPYTAFHTLLCV